MPSYELLYFNARGRAEVARYLFALADVEYTDTRYTQDQFKDKKSECVFSGLPELVIDGGKRLCQSDTIARFLAGEFELMGKDKKDRVYIDMLMGCMNDITQQLFPMHFEKDETRKAEMFKNYMEKLPNWLGKIEGFLSANNGGDGWFIGDSVTLADVVVYQSLQWLQGPLAESVKKCSKLSAFCDRFAALPKIEAWIKKRPESEF